MADVPAHLFSCDPGLVSGVAELVYTPEDGIEVMRSAEVSPQQVGVDVDGFTNMYGPTEAIVVAERFTITAQTAKNSQAPWSLEVIGLMKYIVSRNWGVPYDRALVLQAPADAKGLVPNELMKANGIWHRGGEGHARDALRHGVYTYARLGVRYLWDTP